MSTTIINNNLTNNIDNNWSQNIRHIWWKKQEETTNGDRCDTCYRKVIVTHTARYQHHLCPLCIETQKIRRNTYLRRLREKIVQLFVKIEDVQIHLVYKYCNNILI